ncbi:transposase [Tunicatimonas pelagia]|uniref:transposase n=1 Tax=Tunicatimonas pelagia TaxID=931531 RepID=UPI002665DD6C|nr:transposase [Tunicatimonas pelagia]WKN40534.1 transposase [Tunicatimonas pelagia]
MKIPEREVWFYIHPTQFCCLSCKRCFFGHLNWVVKGKSYTQRQAKRIVEICEKQSSSQVAGTPVGALVGMCPNTVEHLFYQWAEQVIVLPERYAAVKKLGIDEIAHRKGRKDYVCVLTDLERGIQLAMLPNRKKEILMAHFKGLGEKFCHQIKVVSCDIWKTYVQVSQVFFLARYCFDLPQRKRILLSNPTPIIRSERHSR